ncbi:MAG: ABC transporter permease [Coprobacillus sp.]
MENSKRKYVNQEFELANDEEKKVNEIDQVRPSLSFSKETVLMLMHNKVVIVCMIILIVLIFGAIVFPMVSPFDFASQNVAFANKPMMSKDPINGVIHFFGTDHLGRDIFVRIWYGVRVSLIVASLAALIDTVVGVLYGCISGYFGGTVDDVMMRFLEIISGIPYLIVVLLLMAVLPQGIGTLILAYTLVGWTGMARLIRGQVLSLHHKEFVVASKVMGARMFHVIRRHLIPNMMGLIIVNLTLDIPDIIFTEAFLSMLGMGVPAPYPSLGVMANEGIRVFQTYPTRLIIPAILICLITLAFNLLGDKFQDIMNPRLRRGIKYGKHSQD